MRRSNYKYTLFSGLIIVVLSVFLLACTEKDDNTIRIGILKGPSTVSFIQMLDNPAPINGKEVKFIIKDEPMQIQALMMQGKVDFAILPTIMAANLYNKGVDYRMVACPVWGTLYLLTNRNEMTLDSLKNKSVAVFGQGSTSDILTRRTLLRNGVTNVRIDYTYSNNTEIAQALRYKKVNFAVVSEPLVSNLLTLDSTISIVRKIGCEAYLNNVENDIFVQTAFLVSGRFTKKYSELIPFVCEAYTQSCNFLNDQPEKAAQLMVKYKLSPSLSAARTSLPLCNIHYVGAFALEQEVHKYFDIFYQFNPDCIGGKVPDNEFIYQIY